MHPSIQDAREFQNRVLGGIPGNSKICLLFLIRDADETNAWIAEKDSILSSDDYGRDLAGVESLQRKHDGIERDLAALEDKV